MVASAAAAATVWSIRANTKTPTIACIAAPKRLRARLSYEPLRPFLYAPVVRPKGMWRRKFWRLQDSVDEADRARSMKVRAIWLGK